MVTLHVIPRGDLIDHDSNDDCVCGPTTEAVPMGEYGYGWMSWHHSLDGREHTETTEHEQRDAR